VEKLATPLTAAAVTVPVSVPPAGFAPIAIVTLPVKLGTVFPNASRALTTTAGEITAPATVFVGWPVNAKALTAPGFTVTDAVCVTVTPEIAAVIVFNPATVELRLPVATPFPSVTPAGCVSVFPVPVAVSTTAAPLIGLPKASFAVTVSVVALVPEEVVIAVGAATTVDSVPETGAAVMVKGALGGPVSVPDVAARV
jgi:hypothetical protein